MSDAHAFAIQGLSIGWHATSWNATVWMWKRNMFLVSISVLTSKLSVSNLFFLYISESCAINKGNLCENPPFNFTPLSHFAVFLDLSCRHLHRKVKSPLSKFLPYASSCWTHQFFVVYERWPVAQSWNSFLKKRKSQLHSELTVWHTFFLSHSQVARYGCYVTFLSISRLTQHPLASVWDTSGFAETVPNNRTLKASQATERSVTKPM